MIDNSLNNNIRKQNQQILIWNCNGFYNKHKQIKLLNCNFNANILCLQETRINKEDTLKLRGFSSIIKANSTRQGGVGILVKDGIIYDPINLTTDLQAVAIKAYLGKSITVATLYISPSTNLLISDLENLLAQLSRPCIITGDFNAHNPLWDPTHSRNSRGHILEKFIENNNMVLLNTGKFTRMPTVDGNRPSVIDLTICDPEIAHLISWDTAEDTYTSDHFPIILDIALKQDKEFTNVRFNVSKIDVPVFMNQANLSPISDTKSTTEIFEQLIKEVTNAACLSTPMSGGKSVKKAVPWWNEEIKNAIMGQKKSS